MTRILMVITSLFLFLHSETQAQQYRWVKSGGSSCTPALSRDNDKITYMCTDGNRNIYAIAVVGGEDITADTFFRANRHYVSGDCNEPSTLILSYNCNGQMRWTKLFDTYGTMTALDIKYDNAGSIYIVGYSTPNYTKYYTDTTVTSPYYGMFLMKYDTLGKMKWLRYLGANNVSNQLQNSGIAKLAIDGQGNPHHFILCKTGLVISPTVTAQAGTYDIKYSPAGTLMSATRLPLDSLWEMRQVMYASGNNFYATLQRVNPPAINYGLMKFSATDNLMWSDTTGFSCGLPAFSYDGNNGIFVAGSGRSGMTAYFAGMNAANSYYPVYGFGLIAKVDTNGVGKWMVHYDCSQSLGGITGISFLPNGNVAATGIFAYTLRRGLDSIVTPSNEGQNPYLVILDSAGNTLKLDQIHGTGFYDGTYSATADNAGNFYMGGQYEVNITAPGLGTGITTASGPTDFFIMKYGYVCNCTTPVANYTSAVPTGKTVSYTYNGTTTGIDSVVWNWGDGQKQKITTGFTTPVSHTFIANGKFNVCVTAYSQCGTNSYCKQTPLAVSSMAELGEIKVYPNPANQYVTIEGAEGALAALTNSVGQRAMQFKVNTNKQVMDIASLPVGIYILQLTDAKGNRGAMNIVKQ